MMKVILAITSLLQCICLETPLLKKDLWKISLRFLPRKSEGKAFQLHKGFSQFSTSYNDVPDEVWAKMESAMENPAAWKHLCFVDKKHLFYEHSESKRIFVENGIDFGKEYPLHDAVHSGCTDILGAFIEAGYDVKQPTIHGVTPLHVAVWRNYPELVQMLLDAGADMDAKSAGPQGTTPLEDARREGRNEIVKKFQANMLQELGKI
jgi:hypothetical protein